VVGGYLQRLDGDLRTQGFGGELLIVQSNGGVMSRQTACDVPVRTALSGPAAGVMACAEIARASGFENVITGDIGGTSFDVSLVAGGEAALAAQTSIEFGLVVRSPRSMRVACCKSVPSRPAAFPARPVMGAATPAPR
jgi:N-methylhydantoinase A